jgi:deazaflavin-dependent oxidoreductase (nitroreductase family)
MSALPPQIAKMSRVPHRLLDLGVPMGPLKLLRTRGRRSGKPRTIPVVTFRHDGVEWLVSPFGDTAWVHNARADGHAEIGRGRRFRQVRLIEIDDARKPEVLWRYRRWFGIVPFVRHAFRATPRQGPAAFQQEAGGHPVFVAQPAD